MDVGEVGDGEREDEESIDMGGVWIIGSVEEKIPAVQTKNRFEFFADENEEEEECSADQCFPATEDNHDAVSMTSSACRCCPAIRWTSRKFTGPKGKIKQKKEEEIDVCAVDPKDEDKMWTRLSSMTFNVANVSKPLAAASKVVQAGNKVALSPGDEDSYIENVHTGERMKLRVQKGVYVFDIMHEDGEDGVVTLDSGAGVSVWPKDLKKPGDQAGSEEARFEDDGSKRHCDRELGPEAGDVLGWG